MHANAPVEIFHVHKLREGAMLWRFRRGIRAIRYLTIRDMPDPRIVPILEVSLYRSQQATEREILRKESKLLELQTDYLAAADPIAEKPLVTDALDVQREIDRLVDANRERRPLFLRPEVPPNILPAPTIVPDAGPALSAVSAASAVPAPALAAPPSPLEVVYFRRGEALGQTGKAVASARSCDMGWERSGMVTVRLVFRNDGSVSSAVHGDSSMNASARSCVERAFGNIQVGAFTYPPDSVELTKTFVIAARK